ncbi:hypothetical protein ACHWQZ_G010228 [Mnemiopsis leidyi]
MNFRKFFLWISDGASGTDHQIEKLEKMWQEKLIEDLFKGTLSSPEEEGTLSPDESTTLVARKHTLTPERQFFRDTAGDQFAGQRLKKSFQQDLSANFKQPADQDKLSQSNIKDRIAELMPMGEHSTVPREPITLEHHETETAANFGDRNEEEPTQVRSTTKLLPTQDNQNILESEQKVKKAGMELAELVPEQHNSADNELLQGPEEKTAANIQDGRASEVEAQPEQDVVVDEKEAEKELEQEVKISKDPDGETDNSAETTPLPKQPQMVLLLTGSRHGSTWLMDMLSVREEAVPVFEPLNSAPFLKMYAVSRETRDETLAMGYDPVKYADWREVYLARICLCDWHGVMVPKEKDRHYQSIMGLGYKAKRLGTDYKMEYKQSMEKCLKEESMMVPKTIRYYNMTTLYKIIDFGCDNFKVIHLVRDPRAVMTSRMSVFHELYDGNKLLGAHIKDKAGQAGFNESYMTTAADWMCSHHLENYKLGMNPPPWLKGRYKMVRYEDLAEFPQVWARELLHFIGVSYTAKYKEYVYNTTHVKDRGKKDGGYYGVERQSIEMLDKWKQKLIEPHWRTIEKVCADMMKAFNYKPTFLDPKE